MVVKSKIETNYFAVSLVICYDINKVCDEIAKEHSLLAKLVKKKIYRKIIENLLDNYKVRITNYKKENIDKIVEKHKKRLLEKYDEVKREIIKALLEKRKEYLESAKRRKETAKITKELREAIKNKEFEKISKIFRENKNNKSVAKIIINELIKNIVEYDYKYDTIYLNDIRNHLALVSLREVNKYYEAYTICQLVIDLKKRRIIEEIDVNAESEYSDLKEYLADKF